MRYIINTGLKLFATVVIISTVLASCKKDDEFFDIEDPQGIDSQIWNDEGAVGLFLNRTYGLIIPQWPAPGTAPGNIHITSDEMNGGNTALLYGTLVENSITDIGTANNITNNRYFDIRRCNLALQGLDTSIIAPATRNLLKGQFFFLRAYTYFRLVNLYGGVPLILEAQELTAEGVPSVPRAKTSECIAAIVKDLDSAAANLPAVWTGNDIGRITRATAMAMKGKVLMYWASPQFNPTNIASRWEDAYQANLAAYTQGGADGYILLANYANIFTTEDHREVMLVRKYNTNRDLGTNIEAITRPQSETQGTSGSFQPTWNLVQAYTMNNGLPISHASSGYTLNQFWLNRDPRFEATISYNGAAWPLSSKATRRQWQYTGVLDEPSGTIVTGFYNKRFCNTTLTPTQVVYNSNSGGGNGMDWIEMRFAEVVLNLAECANETGRLTEAKDNVRRIRQRAGIVAGSFDYGLSVATDAASMRTLILNERMVEFAMEGKRNFDLRRTRNLNLITARQSLKFAPKSPYFAGTGTTPGRIYLDMPNAQGIKPRDTANLNNPSVQAAIFGAPTIASIEGSNVISIPAKYYFYALPNFFSQNSFVIQQTAGWINGTFDPLQ
ncbi:MAG: RagB/SusD family nutrient uptake outer membrane protein [Flavihumibacter sp.]|nr:RagB/SusD family nutrient uptake outer membrane protein [Flavihumibacter sp.]